MRRPPGRRRRRSRSHPWWSPPSAASGGMPIATRSHGPASAQEKTWAFAHVSGRPRWGPVEASRPTEPHEYTRSPGVSRVDRVAGDRRRIGASRASPTSDGACARGGRLRERPGWRHRRATPCSPQSWGPGPSAGRAEGPPRPGGVGPGRAGAQCRGGGGPPPPRRRRRPRGCGRRTRRGGPGSRRRCRWGTCGGPGRCGPRARGAPAAAPPGRRGAPGRPRTCRAAGRPAWTRRVLRWFTSVMRAAFPI